MTLSTDRKPRELTQEEMLLIAGGWDGGTITVTGGGGGGSFGGFGSGFSFSSFYDNFFSGYTDSYSGDSGGGGITIALDPIDSDGDGTPDDSDQAPYDANNNTIVVTATPEQVQIAKFAYDAAQRDLNVLTVLLASGVKYFSGTSGAALAGAATAFTLARETELNHLADSYYREQYFGQGLYSNYPGNNSRNPGSEVLQEQ